MRPFGDAPFAERAKAGLEAIEDRVHRRRIRVSEIDRHYASIWSVDIDESMREAFPTSPRWDYGIWYRKRVPALAFVEFHKAESGEVDLMLRKKRWLEDQLIGIELPMPTWNWVATGKMLIPPGSSKLRLLQSRGIKLVAGTLALR